MRPPIITIPIGWRKLNSPEIKLSAAGNIPPAIAIFVIMIGRASIAYSTNKIEFLDTTPINSSFSCSGFLVHFHSFKVTMNKEVLLLLNFKAVSQVLTSDTFYLQFSGRLMMKLGMQANRRTLALQDRNRCGSAAGGHEMLHRYSRKSIKLYVPLRKCPNIYFYRVKFLHM